MRVDQTPAETLMREALEAIADELTTPPINASQNSTEMTVYAIVSHTLEQLERI